MLLEYLSDESERKCMAAYSLRRLSARYYGPVVRVRRASDGAMDDFWRGGKIMYNSTRQVLQTWLGSSQGYVHTWYDQSGSGNHATNATPSEQPLIVIAPDWSPSEFTVRFNGAQSLAWNGEGIANSDYTVCASAARASSKAFNIFIGGLTNQQNRLLHLGYRSNTTMTHAQYSNDYDQTVDGFQYRTGVTLSVRHSGTLGKNMHINGAFQKSSADTTSLLSYSDARIGVLRTSTTTVYYEGDVSEILVVARYITDQERSVIDTDMLNAFQNRLVPSVQPAPYIAFSLRNIVQSYTGPVVCVMRSTDASQADFYARGKSGTLLVNNLSQTLEQWLGGATGYAIIWYDQSGSGNHAIAVELGELPVLAKAQGEYIIRFDDSSYLDLGGTQWVLSNGFSSVVRANLQNSVELYNLSDGTGAGGFVHGRSVNTVFPTFTVYEDNTAYQFVIQSPTIANRVQTFAARLTKTGANQWEAAQWLDFSKTTTEHTATLSDRVLTQGQIGRATVSDLVFYNTSLTDGQITELCRSIQPRVYQDTPFIAYSLRNINPEYQGPMFLLERATDAAQCPFYALGDQRTILLNTARQTPEQWLGSAVGYIHTWYDQSGRGQDAVSYTVGTGEKPVLKTVDGVYVIAFRETSPNNGGYMNFGPSTWNVRTNSGLSLVSRVYFKRGSTGGRLFDIGTSITLITVQESSNTIRFAIDGGGYLVHDTPSTVLRDSLQTISLTFTPVTSNTTWATRLTVDHDVFTFTGTRTLNDRTSTTSYIGRSTNEVNSFTDMDLTDLIFYNTGLSEAQITHATNSVQAPLTRNVTVPRLLAVGTCPLQGLSSTARAACRAAYGLSSLSSTYTGPAVRIRRALDNAEDNFFAVGTRLLVRMNSLTGKFETLHEWLGASTGYCTVWYDQSGNGNHSVTVFGNGPVVTNANTYGNNPSLVWQLSFDNNTYIQVPTSMLTSYSQVSVVSNVAFNGGAQSAYLLHVYDPMLDDRYPISNAKLSWAQNGNLGTMRAAANGILQAITTTTVSRSVKRQLGLVFNGSNVFAYVNGVLEGTSASGPASQYNATNDRIHIGGAPGSLGLERRMYGDLQSIFFFSTAISTNDLSILQ